MFGPAMKRDELRAGGSILRAGLLAALAAAACGSSAAPAPDCRTAIHGAAGVRGAGEAGAFEAAHVKRCSEEKWAPSIRTCIAGAKTPGALDSCLLGREVPVGGHKRTEAELNLDYLRKASALRYAEYLDYAALSSELTPSTPCCAQPDHRCPADGSLWTGVAVWDALDFEVPEPSKYQYAYQSDGQTYVARAVGDEDCDGQVVTWILKGAVGPDGLPVAKLYQFNVE
jgi:hypothetical protein